MSSAFIGDGYSETATILATKRYPEVHITFRPMRRAERDRLVMRGVKASQQGGDLQVMEATQQVAASLAKHLIEWDITFASKSPEGEAVDKPLPITAENILSLEPNLFEKIYDRVAGFRDAAERDEEKLAESERAAEKN